MIDDNQKDILCDDYNPIVDSSWNEPPLLNWIAIALGVAVVVLLVLFWPGVSQADVARETAVYAVIGEAEGEGYVGMLAVSCAIRNRGTLKGVYGVNSPRVKNHLYSSKIFVQAVRAWEDSSHPHLCEFIGGATHWEGTAFKTPYWAKDMTLTATVGRQRFYKEKR